MRPLRWQAGLPCIDSGNAAKLDHADIAACFKGPHFLVRPRRRLGRDCHARDPLRMARAHHQDVTPRSQLHGQHAVGIEPCRQRSLEVDGDKTVRQRCADELFARFAGHIEFDAGIQLHRAVVDQSAHDRQTEAVLLRCRARRAASATQPDASFSVDVGRSNGHAIDGQADQPAIKRHGHEFRQSRPAEATADGIGTGCESEARSRVMFHHRASRVVDHDLLRPGLGVARQRDPAFGKHLPLGAEAPAIRFEFQRDSGRPCAAPLAATVGQQRAVAVGVRGEHPVDPGL